MVEMNITTTTPNGVLLKTKGEFCESDITVVPELDEIEITENDVYVSTKTGFRKAIVNVNAAPNIQPLSVTERGTHVATGGVSGYSPVTIDVFSVDEVVENSVITELVLPKAKRILLSRLNSMSALRSLIAPEVEEIGKAGCANLTSLTSVSLPKLKAIGENGLGNAAKLTSLTLPLLESVDRRGLQYLGVTEFEFPSTITQIGTQALRNSKNLTTVTFRGTPTSLPSTTFQGCSALERINVPWAQDAVAGAPWTNTANVTINYNYTGD